MNIKLNIHTHSTGGQCNFQGGRGGGGVGPKATILKRKYGA